ncbi:MAG: ubiquinone/menaquinone biosynthesis methyltransferase [Anaerolineales bacterium]|nr:ubiquinone/menaquinone biosynthesis methyltransferase [Anaerolineales bacterium]
MTEQQEDNKLLQQQDLFSRIAARYDLVNHLMTGWQDNRWRRFAVKKLGLPQSASLLDIGSGNGQIVLEAGRQYPDCICVAADLTLAMLAVGQRKKFPIQPNWIAGDAGLLPFQEGIFDGVISGFLIRNLGDIIVGLKNQYRILKTGGRIAILDTTKPSNHILAPIIRFYMTTIIPIIGGFLTGNKEAYAYLNKSTEGFMRAEELAVYLAAVGFKKVAYRQFAFGMITVHWGEK